MAAWEGGGLGGGLRGGLLYRFHEYRAGRGACVGGQGSMWNSVSRHSYEKHEDK